jgi:predicted acylesterase/phospholipase RssA
MIKNLILSGGASKGYSYLGVLHSLEENNFIKDIQFFCGTSVGSIFATLFCMGFTYNELSNFLNETIQVDDVNIDYLFESYGFYSGKELLDLIKKIISTKYNQNITFQELHKITNKKLIICVTDLKNHCIEYLNEEKYPNMKIIDAIRYAITIPFIFTIHPCNDNMFVDAAILKNISFYNFKPKETISILLKDGDDDKKYNIDTIEDFIKNLLICLKKNTINKFDDNFNILEIKIENIDILDFNLDNKKRKYLYNTGFELTNKYLKKIK